MAAELAQLGVSVSVVDPALGQPWERSYGSWSGGLPADLVGAASVGRFRRPQVVFSNGDQTTVDHEYVRFSTHLLQSELERRARAAGAELTPARFERAERRGAETIAVVREPNGEERRLCGRLLVDCRGGPGRVPGDAGGVRPRRAPAFQSAFGAWMVVRRLPFGEGEMCLMDLRSVDAPQRAAAPPSFLYAMPEGAGVLFAQETVLASRRPVSMALLEARLQRRLAALGVTIEKTLATERCSIPLGVPPPGVDSAVLAFGAAAGLVQPSSGYCLARILREAPRLAEALAAGLARARRRPEQLIRAGLDALWPADARRAFALYQLGLETLLGWGQTDLDSFWRAFFALPGDSAPRFMEGSLGARDTAHAMSRVFVGVPFPLRFELIRGGARFISRATQGIS